MVRMAHWPAGQTGAGQSIRHCSTARKAVSLWRSGSSSARKGSVSGGMAAAAAQGKAVSLPEDPPAGPGSSGRRPERAHKPQGD